ncbi:MAG TPA: hypothetical protein PL155_01460 [Candidatus Omnitrophota bacterium]|nr:hypothetical protein [Candidatus Omnitrophota bacterium]HPD84846.1 hypothetical protein [Candidatus Omnitrophota bacterium]HRZ03704.1 hypothetical protein [Candidatus Omnitrophota bacterium]
MRKRVVAALIILGAFLFAKPHGLFAQPLGLGDEQLSLQKAEVVDIEDATLPAGSNLRVAKEVKYVAGKDGQWFTKDDKVYRYYITEYNRQGKLTKKKCFAGIIDFALGSDEEMQDYEYDENGAPVKEVFYKNKGRGEDAEEYRSLYEHDASGRKTRAVRYNSKGEVVRYTTYAYGPFGQVTQDIEYVGQGADHKWFTADDEIEKCHKHEYDDQGKMTRAMEYHAQHEGLGPDGQWFTPDDIISSTRVFVYNKDGLATEVFKYIGPGQDNIWLTNDDALQYYTKRYYKKVHTEDK